MISAQKPANENARLSNLEAYSIMDTHADKGFDEIVALASTICGTPISLVTLLDDRRQWFKARHGLDITETTRETAFCAHAILQNDIMVVPDALEDERFFDNPLVIGFPDIRFYAGMPLITPSGYKMGTLCVIDSQPRELTATQLYSLEILSRQVVKQMELHKNNLELSRINEVDKKLLSIIAHDLRSPFSSIYSVLDLVEQYNLPPEQFKAMVPMMRQSVNTGLDLVGNLVEWALTQFEGKGTVKESVSIKDTVDQIIAANQQLFDRKGNLARNTIPDTHAVYADKKKIEFVFRNLLLNANKFTNNGTIKVSSKIQEGKLSICISDTGKGIPSTIIDNLFSWQKKTSTEGTHGEKGSGLGLPMCKEFIEADGGKIWVECTPGKETCFYFTLPAMD